MTTKELVLDERRRANLARFGRRQDARYLVEEFPDGTLVLSPAVTVSAAEWAALSNPEVVQAIDAAKDADRTQYRPRPRRAAHKDS